MITMNRVFVAILIAFACVWVWATVRARQESAAAKAFYAQQVAPAFEAEKRQEKAFEQALDDHHQGKMLPLPTLDNAPFNEWMQRLDRRNHYIYMPILDSYGLRWFL